MGNNELSRFFNDDQFLFAVLGPLSWMIIFQSIFLGEKVQAISSTPSNWCAETGGSTCHRNHPWSGCCQGDQLVLEHCRKTRLYSVDATLKKTKVHVRTTAAPFQSWLWNQFEFLHLGICLTAPCTSQEFPLGKHFGIAFYCTSNLRNPWEFGIIAHIRGANRTKPPKTLHLAGWHIHK